jgi:glycosyltransferase involved in cell wall biosynthesis
MKVDAPVWQTNENSGIIRARACIVRQNGYPEDMLVRREAQALKQAGFDVDVICVYSSHHVSRETIDGIQIHRLPPRRKKGSIVRYLFEYLTFFFLVALKLTKLHLQRPFALIQVNTMPDFLVFATLIPRLLGAKVVLQMYEPMPELWMTKFRFSPLIKLLEVIQQLSLRYAHSAFAVTEQLKNSFVARGADPDKISVILNTPDARFFQVDTAAPAHDSDGYFTMICHGAIEERYGHDTMLEAIHSLKSDIPNIRLRVLGRGSYLEKFLAQIEALDLEDYVQYLGYVPLPQLVEELCGADVGIVAQKSSRYSQLVHTGKMYDYLHFSKPVLASRLQAVEAYFEPGALYYFEPGDAKSLAEGILDLYRHPAKRQALVENAQRLYDQYKWERQKDVYLSVYRAMMRQ